MKIRFQDHLIYWLLPGVVVLICEFIYFFNLGGLGYVISPAINREFGLIENLQLLIILVILCYAVKGARSTSSRFRKRLFWVIAAATFVVFLEEMDYGLHFIDYFSGKNRQDLTPELVGEKKVRNIHNNGNLTHLLKVTSYVLMVIFFVVIPLVPDSKKKKWPIFMFSSPSRIIIITVISLFIVNKIAFYLYHFHDYSNGSLKSNVSEFEETMFYYLVLLYIQELANKPLQQKR